MKKIRMVSGGPSGHTPQGGTGGCAIPLGDETFVGIPNPPLNPPPTVDKGHGRARISRDDMFMTICEIVAQRSTCWRSQVGALIVKEGRIVSMGYNGPVSGMPPCVGRDPYLDSLDLRNPYFSTPEGQEYSQRVCMGPGCTRSLHAETNAIAFAAKAGVSVEGCTMYCSMSPCINCAKVIVNSGIKVVKYLNEYRDASGLELLRAAGILVNYLGVPK